jgi:hypothetical protein
MESEDASIPHGPTSDQELMERTERTITNLLNTGKVSEQRAEEMRTLLRTKGHVAFWKEWRSEVERLTAS